MKFSKMHGLGNDFIIVSGDDAGLAEPAEAARRLCRRRFGIGADGLVLLLPTGQADALMRVFNADGSEAEICGNALRCAARYLGDRGPARGPHITVQTGAGPVGADLLPGGAVRVEMGTPVLESAAIPVSGAPRQVIGEDITAGGDTYKFSAVSMGNPHCVIFLAKGQEVNVGAAGPALERHPLFPRGANVEFCRVVNPAEVEVRVWERGAGETPACGTGACAVVVAGVLQGKLERRAAVRLPGGTLEIEWNPCGSVYMQGAAEYVFDGEISASTLKASDIIHD